MSTSTSYKTTESVDITTSKLTVGTTTLIMDSSSYVSVTTQPFLSTTETVLTTIRSSSSVAMSTLPDRLSGLVSYRCVNSCYEIANSGEHKISPQVTTHILVECAKCTNEIALKRVFYTLRLKNGTNCGAHEFTSVESRNASISIVELFAYDKEINSSYKVEYVNFTAIIEDHNAKISDSYSFKLMVNQPPSGAKCTITPVSVSSLEKATFRSENWIDDDLIVSYNIFSKHRFNCHNRFLESIVKPFSLHDHKYLPLEQIQELILFVLSKKNCKRRN
uniref:REJ domain-containing protein n=1 Tax=Syphacia muris TaxID=451379 RepID=A0A0N5ACQ7_9BILA